MTQIKDWPELVTYDPSYYAPIQKSDGTTRAILLANIVGGLSAWQLKTGSYAAVAGDRLRVDATAGDVVISLPIAPTASGADIWIQRLDTSANKVLLRSGANKINGQSGQDGVFAPAVIQLIERVSYVNSTIGWLGQYDRLTYQAYAGGGGGDSTLLLHLDGTNGSTTIVDSSPSPKLANTFGAAALSTTQAKFGTTSLYLPNASSGIQISDTAAIEFLANDFTIEFWQNLTSAGYIVGKGNATNVAGSSISWAYGIGAQFYCNSISTYTLSTPTPASGSFKHIAITRQVGTLRYFIDGVLTSSLSIPASASINNTTQPLQFGAYGPGGSIGYLDEIVIDIGICRYDATFTPPTAPRVS